MLIACIGLGLAAVAFAVAFVSSARHTRALQGQLAKVGDAELEAARIVNHARALFMDAEDEYMRTQAMRQRLVEEVEQLESQLASLRFEVEDEASFEQVPTAQYAASAPV